MEKKLFIYLLMAALIGGLVGSAVSALPLKANLFQDFFQKISPDFYQQTKEGQEPENQGTNPVSLYEPKADYEQMMVKAVEKASPAVVSIIISKDLPIIENCPFSPFGDLPPGFQNFFDFGPLQFQRPCSKGGTERREVGGGTGFVVAADGLIVTNKHVVADSKADYTVLTNEGKKYDAKVLAKDSASDLAILKIKVNGLPVLFLGDSDGVKLGQTAIAIGNALGEFRNTVSAGVISGLARNVTAQGGGIEETIEGVIQTDAAINPGNSGGPLLNLKGEVIGINTAIVSGAENIGFAIPINQAKRAINSVKKNGRIVSPYLGTRYIIITAELAEKQKLPVKEGALVRGDQNGPAIVLDSPAAKAGIQAEDIILEINNQKIDRDHSLSSFIQKYGVGDKVAVKIRRGDDILTLKATLEERPEL